MQIFIYLGSGGLWQKIEAHHNEEVAKAGISSRLRHIGDPNLIFVGETIMIPRQSRQPANSGNGRRLNADRTAQGINLKVAYKIEGSENHYRQVLPNCIIEAKLSGTIVIENMMPNRYEHNYELALGRNTAEFKHSMNQFSDHAFKDLTQGVSMGFHSGKVTFQSPIMYKANLGPYNVEVQAENPVTLKGTLKPGPISAESSLGDRKYKYTADVQFDVTVTMKPASRKGPEPMSEPAIVRRPVTICETVYRFAVAVSLIVLGTAAWQMKMVPCAQGTGTTTVGPFMHSVPMGTPDRT